jgi:hypothetical protein
MATGSRPYMLDMTRTTTIIGELIQLTTEQEDITTMLGKEGYAYYKAGLFYDEITLDMCRRVEGALKEVERSKKDLEEGMEENLLLGGDSSGPFTRLRRTFLSSMLRRETAAHERALREHYDELAGRIQGIANNDPRALSAKMLKMVMALRRIKTDIDARWAELETRVKNERKGPMFFLILNMFVVNFFKFSNQQWFRHWIARFESFRSEIGERIHKEVVHDLAVEEEPARPAKDDGAGTSSRGRARPPAEPLEQDLDEDVDFEEPPPSRAPVRPYAPPAPSAASSARDPYSDGYEFGYDDVDHFAERPREEERDAPPSPRTRPAVRDLDDEAPPPRRPVARDLDDEAPPPPRRPVARGLDDVAPPPRSRPLARDLDDEEPPPPPRGRSAARGREDDGRLAPPPPPIPERDPVKRPDRLPLERRPSLFETAAQSADAPPPPPPPRPSPPRPAEEAPRAQIIPRQSQKRRPDFIQLPKKDAPEDEA